MSTATATSRRSTDPATLIADAGHDLLVALRTVVEQHPASQPAPEAVTALLDEVTALLRRTRGRVNRAVRRLIPPAPPAQKPPATALAPAPTATVRPPASRAVPAVVPARDARRRGHWLLLVLGLVVAVAAVVRHGLGRSP